MHTTEIKNEKMVDIQIMDGGKHVRILSILNFREISTTNVFYMTVHSMGKLT